MVGRKRGEGGIERLYTVFFFSIAALEYMMSFTLNNDQPPVVIIIDD